MASKLSFALLSVFLTANLWAAGVPVGGVSAFGGVSVPSGWLACDGGQYTCAGQPDLFAVLGYIYGGAGGVFNVPDFRGRVGVGSSSGYVLGSAGGASSVVLSVAELPPHNHGLPGGVMSWPSPVNGYSWAGWGTAWPNINVQYATAYAGSGQAFSIMPPYRVVNYIIKAVPDDDGFAVLNESLLWRLKTSLWIYGAICALICAACFFSRS